MRLSLSWLREFVPVESEADEIAERLSATGLAVEEILRPGAGISGVVVAEVRAVRAHPNADNLMLVRAFDGAQEWDIVCGARNYVVGDRVPLALPGGRLPGGVEIGRRRVRGEPSEGMLCSAREMRVAEDHSGILILDADAPLGCDVVEALDLDDVVFDIDVTPNRPDCLSVVGVAREVAAIYGLPLVIPTPVVSEGDEEAGRLASVSIEDSDGCPRYVARVVEGVSAGVSPWWMRRRILAAGMRPISAVVDVTNYVLLERGQPLHAFDLDRLSDAGVVVRRPRPGENIETLDGQKRDLATDDLLICDGRGPVAVAGIMGGALTEVSGTTTRVLLESAWFTSLRIATTARRLGLRTEASVRFERGIDPEGVHAAADRAAELLTEVCGARVARGSIDVGTRRWEPREVRLRAPRARALIGADISDAEMVGSLRRLGCRVETAEGAFRVHPPSHRVDLAIEEDLVEEVARLYGPDRVPETLPAGARTGRLTESQRRRRIARAALLGTGLSEAQTLSLLPRGLADRLSLLAEDQLRRARTLSNPLSEDEAVLRPSLVYGLLLAASRNAARRVLPVRLFEIGKTFTPTLDGVCERVSAGWILTGPASRSWQETERPLDFFDAKGVVEALMSALGVDDWDTEAGNGTFPFHPGRYGVVRIGGESVGFVAEILPSVAEVLELPEQVAVAEIDLGSILDRSPVVRAPALPRFPAVARDIALVVPDATPAADVRAAIAASAGGILESVEVFDVYRGHPVADGCVSLAFSLTLRDPERTLTDADADAAMGRIVAEATSAGWSVRE
ncbi:MAG: phenylalanine--tRNA ligase subunit beta [Actinomycetota bacterium]